MEKLTPPCDFRKAPTMHDSIKAYHVKLYLLYVTDPHKNTISTHTFKFLGDCSDNQALLNELGYEVSTDVRLLYVSECFHKSLFTQIVNFENSLKNVFETDND